MQLEGLLEGVVSPVARLLTTQDNTQRRNADKHPCLLVGSEPTIPLFERAKTAVNVEQANVGKEMITAYFNLLSQPSREESE
jgi:hypothetical protein